MLVPHSSRLLAVDAGCLPIVRLLVDEGADVHPRSLAQPLSLRAEGNPEMTRYLLGICFESDMEWLLASEEEIELELIMRGEQLPTDWRRRQRKLAKHKAQRRALAEQLWALGRGRCHRQDEA